MGAATILIVDPDASFRRELALSLDQRGYLVSSAETGQDALERIAAEPFDILILNVSLGDGNDGIDVCRRAKAIRGEEAPGVLFISPKSDPRAKVAALDAGGDAVFVKPVDLDGPLPSRWTHQCW